MKTLNPPTDDPKLPSFEREEFKAIKPTLQQLGDFWRGGLHRLPPEAAQQYLPKNYMEPASEYVRRLRRSHYDNFFRRAIVGYAGAFSKFERETQIPDDFFDDCDRHGTSFKGFFDMACALAMRDRYCFIFPQFHKNNANPRNRAEELASGNRPFVSIVKAIQVPNWGCDENGLLHVTILEKHVKDRALFGNTYEQLYRVIRRENGRITWTLQRLVQTESADNGWAVVTVDEGELTGSSGRPLSQIPLIPLTTASLQWWNAETPFPFLDLADLCLQKFQVDSDRREIEHKTVPTWAIAPGQGCKAIDDDGNLMIGSNSFLNLGMGGNAFILEANGNGLEALFKESTTLEAQMRKVSLEFAQTSGPERKEVEIKLDLQDLQVNLERMANMLESSVQMAFSILAELLGLSEGGTISIAIDMSVFLFSIQDIQLAVAGKFLSRETAVRRMVQLGYSEDPDAELERLKLEEESEMRAITGAMNTRQDDEELEEF